MDTKPPQEVQILEFLFHVLSIFDFQHQNPHGFHVSEEWAHALNLFQHFGAVGQNVVTYSAAISALEKVFSPRLEGIDLQKKDGIVHTYTYIIYNILHIIFICYIML